MSHKIVVIGDIKGKFSTVFNKLNKLHEKQNFALAIVAGNFFASNPEHEAIENSELVDLVTGRIEVHLPVYFTLGRQVLPEALVERLDTKKGELCSNVFALGRKGRVKTSEGIKIVTVSGIHTADPKDQPSSVYGGGYSDKDAKGCISYHEADILITSDWPTDIRHGSRLLKSEPCSKEVDTVADLVVGLAPRYHFSTSEAFYEREPFFHNKEKRPITRFIALAPFGNSSGEKWIYAFTIDPTAEPPAQLPRDVVASPFGARKRKFDSEQVGKSLHGLHSHLWTDGNDRSKRRKAPVQPSGCYFCLANPSCEGHMIVSIGHESYMTTAKGPLPKRDTFGDLGIPGHMLIIPLTHAATIAAIPGEDSKKALAEMTQYKEALQTMLVLTSKDDEGRSKLGAVTFQISRAGGVHHHWQFLPVPREAIDSGTLETFFKSEAASSEYPAFVDEDAEILSLEDGDYFKVELWSESLSKKLVMLLDASFSFDLQFGRRVISQLLGLPQRAHWKDCGQTKHDEATDVARFKQLFKKFDFTLPGFESEKE